MSSVIKVKYSVSPPVIFVAFDVGTPIFKSKLTTTSWSWGNIDSVMPISNDRFLCSTGHAFLVASADTIREIWFYVIVHLPEIHDWFRYPIKSTFPRGHLGYKGTDACCVLQQSRHCVRKRESRHMPLLATWDLADCIWSAFLKCYHLMIGTTGTVTKSSFNNCFVQQRDGNFCCRLLF